MDEELEIADKPISLRNRTIAACVGSFMTSFTVNPFDVARVRMQQSSAVEHMVEPPTNVLRKLGGRLQPYKVSPSTLSAAAANFPAQQVGVDVCCRDVYWFPSSVSYCVASQADPCVLSTPKRPASTLSLLRSVAADEGLPTLWRGVGILLMQAVPSNVVYFISYEHLRDQLVPVTGSSLTPLIAGGFARSLASTIVSPLELLKTRLQSIQVPRGQSAMALSIKSIREMIAAEGYRSLWNGLGLTLWRDVPFSSVYWLVIEAMRSQFPKSRSHTDTFVQSFASGIVGGVVASVVTTPFDVAKTRRQLAHSSCTSNQMSIPKFMRTIWMHDGWSALFVGLAPRTFKVAPACAIMISSYEMGKRILS